jgi:hypothetical protein
MWRSKSAVDCVLVNRRWNGIFSSVCHVIDNFFPLFNIFSKSGSHNVYAIINGLKHRLCNSSRETRPSYPIRGNIQRIVEKTSRCGVEALRCEFGDLFARSGETLSRLQLIFQSFKNCLDLFKRFFSGRYCRRCVTSYSLLLINVFIIIF